MLSKRRGPRKDTSKPAVIIDLRGPSRHARAADSQAKLKPREKRRQSPSA